MTHKIKTIAFPNISTGVYRFPKDLACDVAIHAVQEFIKLHDTDELTDIYFVCFDDENYQLYQNRLNDLNS